MSTHWTRPHVDGDPDNGLVVHTPEEAIHCVRTDSGWLAEAHTVTAEVVLARKRWVQCVVQAQIDAPASSKPSKRKAGS